MVGRVKHQRAGHARRGGGNAGRTLARTLLPALDDLALAKLEAVAFGVVHVAVETLLTVAERT